MIVELLKIRRLIITIKAIALIVFVNRKLCLAEINVSVIN